MIQNLQPEGSSHEFRLTGPEGNYLWDSNTVGSYDLEDGDQLHKTLCQFGGWNELKVKALDDEVYHIKIGGEVFYMKKLGEIIKNLCEAMGLQENCMCLYDPLSNKVDQNKVFAQLKFDFEQMYTLGFEKWTPELHKSFPKPFRDGVVCWLGCLKRKGWKLPKYLKYQIIEEILAKSLQKKKRKANEGLLQKYRITAKTKKPKN